MKVVLEYDGSTGAIKDATGTLIANWVGLQSLEPTEESKADKTVELVKLGVSPDDIIKLKHQGLL